MKLPALSAVALTALFVTTASAAHADLASGKAKFVAGDYHGAVTELKAAAGTGTPTDVADAGLLLVRAQAAVGDYAAAEATATHLMQSKSEPHARAARVARAEVWLAIGRDVEARHDLESLVHDHPDDRAARHLLGTILVRQGDDKAAAAMWQTFIDEYDAHKLDLDNPEQLFYLAEAARYTQQFQLANDSYQEAVKIDPQFVRADLAWADLFVQKYASELAEQTLEDIFKINGNDPDAHAAMAEAIIDGRYDLVQVRDHLGKALAVNPKNVRALLARASIEIDANQWDIASATLAAALAVDPRNTYAMAQQATIAWLRDDMKAYDAIKARAFAINPNYAELYRIVSRSAVREHRYVAAVELEKQAVAVRPKFYEAMSGVGLGYLRLGMEKDGLQWLRKSWDGDKYNVRTYNTLNLYDDTIPKDYSFQSSKTFTIRYPNDEKKVLSRYLEPTMERAFANMVARYGFTPKTPVILELYAEANDYAVRTVGLPSLGALGVCFGQVITAMSPSTGDLNWGMVLWHELGHVFAIQLSNSRVPRWFTEGLSEYETLIARPEWRRENDADLYGAVADGTLPSVVDLNARFMIPDQDAVVVAYFMSAVTIEYIAQTYGFAKIVQALKLFGQDKETPEVLRIITGKTVAQFDADFRAYLAIRLAAYKGTFRMPSLAGDDVTKMEIAAAAKPNDALIRVRLGMARYAAGDAEQAVSDIEAALKMDPTQPVARYLSAEIALRKNDSAKAETIFRGLVADGHDNFDIRVRLATIAQTKNDLVEEEAQLCKAKQLDPERSYPYQELAELYKKQGNVEGSLRELEHYAMIEQMQLAPLKEIVSGYAKLGKWSKVRTYGEMATYINPGDAEILLALGRGYQELGDASRALYTFDTALLTSPPLRRPALAHLGRARALAALGKKAEAKTALTTALSTEPENADALAFKSKLK